VIFDTVTVTIEEARKMGWRVELIPQEEKKGGKVKICYPKVLFKGKGGKQLPRKIVLDGEIVFLSKEEKILKRVPVSRKYRVIWSENGKYILKAKAYDEFDESWQGAVLYDWDGNVIWEKEKGIFTAVSNEGYTATGFVSPTGASYPFIIYNPKGEKIRKFQFDVPLFNAGGTFISAFYIIASGHTLIFVYSESGKEIFRKKVSGYTLHTDVNILSDTILFVPFRTEQNDTLLFLSLSQKNEIKKLPTPLPLIGDIHSYEIKNNIFVYTSNGDLFKIKDFEFKDYVKIDKNLQIFKKWGIKIIKNKVYIFPLKEVLK
jgi:hypothetical protein